MGMELISQKGFTKGPAAAFRGHETDESLADGVGAGYPLIRYGGKVWSLQVRGDVFNFTDAQGYAAPYIDVVILRQARNKSKAYFPDYEEGSKQAPVCSSMDGLVPDAGVEQRQAETCALCPRNVFKKNDRGMMVKECSDAKRLAVVLLPDVTKKILGEPLVEPTFLRVPAASLQNLAQMGEAARKAGYEYFTFLTRIDFDPEKMYPKMRFKAIQELSDAEAETVLKLRDDPQSLRICNGDRGAATVSHEPVRLAAPSNLGLAAPADDKAAITAKFEADRKARLEAARAPVIEAKAEVVEEPQVPLDDVVPEKPKAKAKEVRPAEAPKAEPIADEQSDEDLDALIDSMLPK